MSETEQTTRARYLRWSAILLVAFVAMWLLRALHKPLWRDDVVSVFAAHGSLARAFQIGRGDSSGLLFNPILHLWMKLVGRSALGLRILPLIFSLATVVALQRRARAWLTAAETRPASSAHGLLILAALSLNPVLIFYSTELRNYALFFFFVTLLLLATERLLREERGAWIGVLIASSLTVLVNPLGLIWVLANSIVLAAVAIARGKWRWLAAALGFALVAALALRPWLRQLLEHALALRTGSWIVMQPIELLSELRDVFAPYDQIVVSDLPTNLFAAVCTALALCGAVQVLRDRHQQGPAYFLGLASLAAIPFLVITYVESIFLAPIFFRRYLACSFASFAALTLLGYSLRVFRKRSVLAVAATLHASVLVLMLASIVWPGSELDYAQLAKSDVPVFTAEDPDILPCLYYARDCKFIGAPRNIRRSIGAFWFEEEIPSVSAWSEVRSPELEAVIRNENRDATNRALEALGYEHVGAEVTGILTSLSRWRRAGK
jgi:hypothetical protein